MDDVMRELGRQHAGIAIGRVEAEVVDELTIQFNVATVPTFVLLQAGVVVDSLEGADPPTLTAKVAALTGKTSTGVTNGTPAVAVAPAGSGSDVVGRIKFLMSSHPVLLFMKGNPGTPRCGFSRKVVAALKDIQVPFHTVDILEDDALRQGVKEWGNWPTYPQLYVAGELLGGCDIVLEMAQGSDLKDTILKGTSSLSKPTPTTTSTPTAAAAASEQEGLSSADAQRARLTVLVRSSPVMLFMKGRPEAPQCGFSSAVVGALRDAGIAFGSFDILSDGAVRSGLKEFSQWPTYPQLYVNGELLGGADIVKEMAASGELKEAVAGMLAA